MKLEIEQTDIEAIAQRVFELLLPHVQQKQGPDVILDVESIAALVGKSRGQIYQWVHNASHGLSDFPYLKVGRSLRFSKNEVLQWAKKNSKR
jgi:excisionase family DNA binding protein